MGMRVPGEPEGVEGEASVRLDLDLQPGDERLFVDESLEQIERLEQGLLELEQGEPRADLINEVFRAAHTLKGSAATIRHARMAGLTHAAESVLGAVRDGRLDGLQSFMSTLLAAVDVLRVLVAEVGVGETLTDEAEPMADTLGRQLASAFDRGAALDGGAGRGVAGAVGGGTVDRVVPAAPTPGTAAIMPPGTSLVRCTADPASPWKAVRLLQALLEADDSGVLLGADPPRERLEAAEEIESLLLTVSAEGEPLQALVGRLASLDELRVEVVPPSETQAVRAVERRKVDLGPEARGATSEERLEIAGERLKQAQQTVRIDVGRLDELMNLVGELVVYKTTALRQARDVAARLGADDPLASEMDRTGQEFVRIASQLQDQVTRLRMLPIETVFNRFPRVVRDLSVRLGKEVELVVEGKETELDRSILEQVGDPLGHLVRNALDHGLETPDERRASGKPPTGRLRLAARHADDRIVITVEDDGRGIDPRRIRKAAVEKGLLSEQAAAALSDEEAIQLVFAAGFSTARVVTDVSGRGVGADVVRTNIERLGGRVGVSSVVGRGTRFELSLPLTLAIVGALLVEAGPRVCALPLASVVETVRLERGAVTTALGRAATVLRGRVLPVRWLDEALGDGGSGPRGGAERFYLAVVRSGDAELALGVDRLVGEQEIVLKSLSGLPGRQPGVAGATTLADGSVALVIDVAALVQRRAGSDRMVPAAAAPLAPGAQTLSAVRVATAAQVPG